MSGTDEALKQEEVVRVLGRELGAIKIPPRPAILASIEKEMRSREPNFKSLGELISLDVGISASLVKIANSAFFGFGGQVRSVKEALQVLGLNTVAVAIAGLSLRKAFAHVPNLERFWDSSARTAQLCGWLAMQLASTTRRVRAEEAYTFGLFRDCGIPVLFSMLTDYFGILRQANNETERRFTDIEDAELGVNHANVGAMLAKEWQLPIEYQAAIEWHHDNDTIRGLYPHLAPDMSRYFIATAQLAEYMFQTLTGLDRTSEWHKLGDACLEVLGIRGEELPELVRKARQDSVHTEPIF